MAFDQTTRNRLQRFVTDARNLLTVEFTRQMQNEYGLDPATGSISPIETLHLDDSRLETARILRDTLDHYRKGSAGSDDKQLLEQIAREQAFTVLNRFAALKMAEARGILIQSLDKGYESQGFQLYQNVAGTGLGETGDAYRAYLFSIFDEFAVDLKVLFDRFSPTGLLFPKETVMLELLGLVNDSEIDPLWAEDETIGWIYQYFNTKEERKKMRDESAAPRNSRELAVRNQFFTPRYVVEFLTDNTLGRTWYEMTKGQTSLAEDCRYLVRRPNEVFLAEGENAPDLSEPGAAATGSDAEQNLSQEELLKQTVYIPHRSLKDPREILMLDPACGSMHFGLYAFDLFLKIYEEAWDLSVSPTSTGGFKPLRETYDNDKERFLLDVPRLIIENNIHGVDIDPRAVQIAGLSLWLRAQRAWAEQNVRAADRPQIRRSNIVCAEPMPGEADLLEEFISEHFADTAEKRLLGEFVRRIFESMQLAGEAGSLLKIEEEVAGLISESREQWQKLQEKGDEKPVLFDYAPVDPQQRLDFQVGEITDANFWDRAESEIYQALRRYSETSENGGGYQRRLFADDAAHGFAFIDICRRKYDVVLMNPPFGQQTPAISGYLSENYRRAKHDMYCAFVERGAELIRLVGLMGAITNRTGFYLKTSSEWRKQLFVEHKQLTVFADLGDGVLDAALVETAAYTVAGQNRDANTTFMRVVESTVEEKGNDLVAAVSGTAPNSVFIASTGEFQSIPLSPFAYWVDRPSRTLFRKNDSLAKLGISCKQGVITANDFRFLRLRWEVTSDRPIFSSKPGEGNWALLAKGGEFRRFVASFDMLVLAANEFEEIIAAANQKYPYLNGGAKNMLHLDAELFQSPGGFYTRRTSSDFSVRALPRGCVFSDKGPGITISTAKSNQIDTWALIGVLNSEPFRSLLALGLGAVGAAARSYETGLVETIPLPSIDSGALQRLHELSLNCYSLLAIEETKNEVSLNFIVPYGIEGLLLPDATFEEVASSETSLKNFYASQVSEHISEINELSWRSYGLDESSKRSLGVSFGRGDEEEQDDDGDVAVEDVAINKRLVCSGVASYILGVVFGRWDVRYAIGARSHPELPDPFTEFPVCPPGMLQNSEGMQASPTDVSQYPVEIVWNGILVDDTGNSQDIDKRLSEVFRAIFNDRAEVIETEACEVLGVRSLREYFRKPTGFFADHLKRYSKSRRQAPIYLPLSTSSGEYTLWLYYHRLTDQTLFSCINDFVEPKIRQVKDDITGLSSKSGRSSNDEKRLAQLTDLSFELEELRDELLRLAPIWKPNLNDGVQITMAPLWKLFRLPKWRKTLEDSWKKLEKGEYDWAHLAYSLWPDRVREKCKKDKSLAIAHDLEDLYEEPPATNKRKGKKAAADQREMDLE